MKTYSIIDTVVDINILISNKSDIGLEEDDITMISIVIIRFAELT
jgi:hypothetical protein